MIASRLTPLQDFFALRAACRTYRALLPPSPANLASQGPLLLVPHEASESEALYHAPLRRMLRFRLPHTHLGRRDRSLTPFHSFGSRVAIHDINFQARHRELRICHVLTGEQVRLPDPTKDFDGVIFSGHLVLAFRRFSSVIYYCRIGDVHWQAAMCDEAYLFCSLLFVEGTLYGLICPNFRLAVVDLHNNSVELSFLGDELSAQTVQNSSLFWLAECHGELLLVVAVEYPYPFFSPLVYHVFRWQSKERKWARTTSLGGCSLFFSELQFTGCLGPDHPAVRKDCLYFTCGGRWREYSLVDGILHEHVADYPERVAMEDYGPLAWVLPSIG